MIRRLGAIVLGSMFVTGCLFPSFDDMQNGERAQDDGKPATESNATEVTAKNGELPSEAGTATSNGGNASADAGTGTGTDAAADVVTKSPGAGKIACPGAGEDCPVGPNIHCCAGYTLANGPYCSSPSHTIGWCTGGGGRAVFCDEKQDCPGSQFCCEKGDVTQCSDTCTGGTVKP